MDAGMERWQIVLVFTMAESVRSQSVLLPILEPNQMQQDRVQMKEIKRNVGDRKTRCVSRGYIGQGHR